MPSPVRRDRSDEKSPPYNYNFASRTIGAGLIASVATMIALIVFTKELDATEANKAATEAAGAMDPTEWEKVRERIQSL